MKAKLLIGTDPEVFLRSKTTGKFVSAHGMFPGTKNEPYPLDQGALQVDGHALEFNTKPVGTEDEFAEVVQHVFNQVKGFVEATTPDLEIALEPIATFDADYFDNLPIESKELGCTPDFSSVTGEVLEPPPINFQPFRTGSGHIHIGWTKYEEAFDEEKFKQRMEMAAKLTPYLLDAALDWENGDSSKRRQFYGREGSFRPKHYGIELRALDNLWLKSETTIRKVFRTTVEAFEREYGNAL